tara:strand:+ start:1972 stop:2082 length:111 start_codon:yes stop_codon:yes gene_type:complete
MADAIDQLIVAGDRVIRRQREVVGHVALPMGTVGQT